MMRVPKSGKRKKHGKPASNSTQPVPSEKQVPKSLKPKDKKFKSAVQPKRLKAKEGEGTSQSQVAEEDRNKTSAEVGKNSDLKSKDNENGRNSFKKNDTQNNKNKKDEKVRADHGPNSERKVAGLVFMCSSRTKPDCFRYNVMAVSAAKKEVVLGVKPGLKLFLYDFDLKLLYGIFEASSAGGMNLEPAAFGGNFPAQVRFKIYEDCLPLPESVFKNAIKENYEERTKKFQTELTSKQVNKLKSLFRPVPKSHKNHLPAHQPSSSSDRLYVTEEEYRTFGLRPRPNLHTLRHGTVSYAPIPEPYQSTQARDQLFRNLAPNYGGTSTTKEQIFRAPAPAYREITREPIGEDPALRYGSLSLPNQADRPDPTLGYGNLSLRKQADRSDPGFLSEDEYRLYGLRGRPEPPSEKPVAQARNSDYYPENKYLLDDYPGMSSDPYRSLPTGPSSTYDVYRQTTMTTSHLTDVRPVVHGIDYRLPRSSTDEVIYSSYPSHELSEYHQRNRQLVGPAELDPKPVSSRYSFAGASYSYR
ncbi:hypothetical protein RND81_05G196500 [Saponaria officinalis]|uniref:DCD domain-containing protein n=1 Tax=Saponaria officinalis TaxID=3572 RepID=A0AAW1L2M0_SAPOF